MRPRDEFRLQSCDSVNQGRQATTAVANAQLLASANVALMRTNRLFYTQKYENRPELFVPSPHIVAFVRRHALEKRFLDFVDERFRYVDGEVRRERPLAAAARLFGCSCRLRTSAIVCHLTSTSTFRIDLTIRCSPSLCLRLASVECFSLPRCSATAVGG